MLALEAHTHIVHIFNSFNLSEFHLSGERNQAITFVLLGFEID